MNRGKKNEGQMGVVPPQNRASKFGGGKLESPKVENRIPNPIYD